MALVEYSESDSSEEDQIATSKQPHIKSKSTSNKPALQKVVDRSNPTKIRVNLPEHNKIETEHDGLERPSKRPRLGPDGLSGFNALLPAPKRAAASTGGSSSNGMRKGGLGSGINLRTGAAPGFSRENDSGTEGKEDEGIVVDTMSAVGTNNGVIAIQGSSPESKLVPPNEVPVVPQPRGKTTMFKPLSVAKKPQKKKPMLSNGSNTHKADSAMAAQRVKTPPKISLFSSAEPHSTGSDSHAAKEPYQPVVYQNDIDVPLHDLHADHDIQAEDQSTSLSHAASTPSTSQSLDAIASDLNLSAAAKRQLLGRQKNNASAINIVNFNTDEEYSANEVARQSGEQVQHNPVRAIAPGKHSLKQLVNMGAMQADALEESFASGRKNRSEAGSKYGW